MALTMLLTMALPAAAANRFEDVERADWYYAAVTTMANEGVVSGYPDGTFRPNDTLTQGECLPAAANRPLPGRTGPRDI